MGWLLLGTALAVASLVVLALVLLSLWRRTKALGRAVAEAGAAVAAGSAGLSALPSPAARHRTDG